MSALLPSGRQHLKPPTALEAVWRVGESEAISLLRHWMQLLRWLLSTQKTATILAKKRPSTAKQSVSAIRSTCRGQAHLIIISKVSGDMTLATKIICRHIKPDFGGVSAVLTDWVSAIPALGSTLRPALIQLQLGEVVYSLPMPSVAQAGSNNKLYAIRQVLRAATAIPTIPDRIQRWYYGTYSGCRDVTQLFAFGTKVRFYTILYPFCHYRRLVRFICVLQLTNSELANTFSNISSTVTNTLFPT